MCDAVSDVAGKLSSEQVADLSALADGTLPADRRDEVEAQVAESPELQQLLEHQRQAVAAVRGLASVDVPASLRTSVKARVARKPRARGLVPKLAFTGATVAAAAVVAAVVLTGGPGGATVADAAALAQQPPAAGAPPKVGKAGTRLALQVEGVSFPDLSRFAGWAAVGVRHARIDGRDATVVYYRKGGRRLGYVIVAGSGLPRPKTSATVIRAEPYQTLRIGGNLAVTWRRGGHTCVLLGRATPAELVHLASWSLTPPPH